MKESETNVSLTYISYFEGDVLQNEFQNIPDDLKNFLEKGGTIRGIKEELYPDQYYAISISIESVQKID